MGKITPVLLLLLLPSVAIAQKTPRWATRSYLDAQWTPAVPLGPSAKETGYPGFAGGAVGYRLRINDRYSAGPRVTMCMLEDRQAVTVTTDAGRTSATTHLSLRTVHLAIVQHIYFPGTGPLLPFVGITAGTMRAGRTTAPSGWDLPDRQWHPLIGAELGTVALLQQLPLQFAIDLQWATPSPDASGELLLVTRIGLVWPH